MTAAPRAVILAAGKGSRMGGDLPKVLHRLAGRPLIDHVLDNAAAAGILSPVVVVGHRGAEVRSALSARRGIDFAEQSQQLGTGHAVLQAEPALGGFAGTLAILSGDVPFLSSATLKALLASHLASGAALTVLTMRLEDPARYGRVKRSADGSVAAIVEWKDASEAERSISEVNSGTYAADAPSLFEALRRVGNSNAAGEYYFPDVVPLLLAAGRRVGAVTLDDPGESLGVNTPAELAALEELAAAKRG